MTTTIDLATMYRDALAEAVKAYPDEYPWARDNGDGPRFTVDDVAARMLAAMRAGTYNKDSRAIKAVCKRLGIAHTYKALAPFIADMP